MKKYALIALFLMGCKTSGGSDGPGAPADPCPPIGDVTSCNNNTACLWNSVNPAKCQRKPVCEITANASLCPQTAGCQFDANQQKCIASFTPIAVTCGNLDVNACNQNTTQCKWVATMNKCYGINDTVTTACAQLSTTDCVSAANNTRCRLSQTYPQTCQDIAAAGGTGATGDLCNLIGQYCDQVPTTWNCQRSSGGQCVTRAGAQPLSCSMITGQFITLCNNLAPNCQLQGNVCVAGTGGGTVPGGTSPNYALCTQKTEVNSCNTLKPYCWWGTTAGAQGPSCNSVLTYCQSLTQAACQQGNSASVCKWNGTGCTAIY